MEKILNEIVDIVGVNGVLLGEDVTSRSVDWFTLEPCIAKAIVRPRNTEQVSKVMALCHRAGQSVVTHGGLTGVVRGGATSADDVVISLEHMKTIEEVDAYNGTMLVQAGTTLQTVQEAAEEIDMYFPIDLGARGSCTIGGNIATNAGGVRVIRYGMMRHQVLGLEVVLSDGTIIKSLNKMLKNNAGYDLKDLFIGSEGTLGIVTRAMLRLQPYMTSEQTALVAVPSFHDLTKLLHYSTRHLANTLSAFEVLWNSHYKLVTADTGPHTKPLDDNSPFYAFIETLGANKESDSEAFNSVLENALDQGWITDAVIATSNAQRQEIWEIREDIEILSKELSPLFSYDVSLPISYMEKYVTDIQAEVEKEWPNEGKVVVFGHLGDGNLHLMITVKDKSKLAYEKVSKLVYRDLTKYGGSVSAEHGIGLEKKDYLSISRSDEEICLMRKIKEALDPKGLLNVNKIF